jgi:phage terminase small subunit
MPTISALPTPPPEEPNDDLPSHWSEGAVNTWKAVLEERNDMAAAELAALWTACELITTAEALEASVRDALFVPGSAGQMVLNPAAAEARQARSVIATVMNRLVGPSAKQGAMTNSQRGQMAARARWSGSRR